jgi:hypothetical protein
LLVGHRLSRTYEVPVIEVPVREATVTARVSVGRHTGYTTFLEVKVVLGPGAELVLRPRASSPAPGLSLEELYEIEGQDRDLAPAMVSDEMAVRLTRAVSPSCVDSNGTMVSMTIPGGCDDPEALAAGVDAAAAMAEADPFGLRPLRALSDLDRVERDERTELPAGDLRLPERVRIGPRRGNGTCTVARSAIGRSSTFKIEIGADGNPVASSPLPPGMSASALGFLERAGPATLDCDDGWLELRWPGVERDPARLLAGARAVAATCREAAGVPFR